MTLRNVYSAQVSSTICQECETCCTEEPQTTNDDKKLQELSHAEKFPPVCSQNKGSARSNKIDYLHNPTHAHVLSTKSKIET